MFVKTFVFNPIQVNTYVVIDETTNECVVIDAGCLDEDEKNTLGGYIRNHQLQLGQRTSQKMPKLPSAATAAASEEA